MSRWWWIQIPRWNRRRGLKSLGVFFRLKIGFVSSLGSFGQEKFMYAHGAGDVGECILGEYGPWICFDVRYVCCVVRIFGPYAAMPAVSATRYEYQVVPKGSPEYDDPWGPTHPEGGEGLGRTGKDGRSIALIVRLLAASDFDD